jgi:hypothetical protein
MAIVVVGLAPEEELRRCLESVLAQRLPPCAVAVVAGAEGASAEARAAVERLQRAGLPVVEARSATAADARSAGVQAVRTAVGSPEGWVFVDPHCRLRPGFLEACHHTLRHCPDVGLVSSWQRRARDSRVLVLPDPALPYQWLADDAVACSAFRDEALREAGGFRRALDPACQGWDLANAVLAAGWAGVTYPAVLSEADDPEETIPPARDLRMRRALLERFPELVERGATELLLLQACGVGSVSPRPGSVPPRPDGVPVQSDPAAPTTRERASAPGPRELLRLPLAKQIDYLASAVRHPRRASSWLTRHLRRALVEGLGRGRRAGGR